MIDFKNISKIPRRITKHTVDEGDFYTCSMTSLEKEEIYDNNKKKSDEDLMVIVVAKILCDDKGSLLNLSLKDLKALPDSLFHDIVNACMGNVLGKKKVN